MRLEKRHVYFIILSFFFVLFFLLIFYLSNKQEDTKQAEIDETDIIVERTSIFGERVVPVETSPDIFDPISEEDQSFVSSVFSTEESVVENNKSRLFQLFSGPVSGFSVKTQKPAKGEENISYLVRLVARGIGDIYSIETFPYNITK